MKRIVIIVFFAMLCTMCTTEQSQVVERKYVYVENGVLYMPSGEEMSLWGVNFQPALSWEYHRHEIAGTEQSFEALKEVTDNSLDEIERMGANIFRCHLTPADFTNDRGEIVESLYLDILDYALAEASKRGIYAYITFINHMGSGYIKESMFNRADRKDWMIDPDVIEKSQNYITELLNHTNKFSEVEYKNDANIALWEIINEPQYYTFDEFMKSHFVDQFSLWAAKENQEYNCEENNYQNEENFLLFRADAARDYVDDMYDVIRATGAKQPVSWCCNWHRMIITHHNVFAAIAESKVEVVSICNYPGQNECKKPYWDYPVDNTKTHFDYFLKRCYNDYNYYGWALSPAYKSKAKVVYEFEGFFNGSSAIYPQMARMMRSLGVQAACMWTYSLSDYAHKISGSHNLNEVCTPTKAAGFAVAKEIFESTPLYAPYQIAQPSEDKGDNYYISTSNDLAIYSTKDVYGYTNDTSEGCNSVALPIAPSRILGRGNSHFATTQSNGRYTIDIATDELTLLIEPNIKRNRELWAKGDSSKSVVDVQWDEIYPMSLNIKDWDANAFYPTYKLEGEERVKVSNDQKLSDIRLLPGKYIITRK